MNEQELENQSSASQASSGNSKAKMLVFKDAESFNELDVDYVREQLAEYTDLWEKVVLVDATLYIQPVIGSEKLTLLLAQSLKADEVDLEDNLDSIKHLKDMMAEYKTADYKKDIVAIESLGSGKHVRVWWD